MKTPISCFESTVPALTLEELQRLPRNCPLIYDNDWFRDTPDDDYLMAKAQLGQANLRGFILTKDLWDQGKMYRVAQGQKEFAESREIWQRNGWKNLPELTVGADRVLIRPTSGAIEDTTPQRSPGAELIIREARKARPEQPLLIFVGGPLNTVVNAYLLDPSIAPRLLVFMTDLTGYNGQDKWANYIAASRLRMVNFGASPLWWSQRPAEASLYRPMLNRLPKTAVTEELIRLGALFDERRGRNERDDGFADGAGLFLYFVPESWKAVRKMQVAPNGVTKPADSSPYYLDATAVDFNRMRDEFFATIAKAYSIMTKITV
ncbi:MAG: hypothetical protein OHK0029_34020 [Armatimonadaceae bacterium]